MKATILQIDTHEISTPEMWLVSKNETHMDMECAFNSRIQVTVWDYDEEEYNRLQLEDGDAPDFEISRYIYAQTQDKNFEPLGIWLKVNGLPLPDVLRVCGGEDGFGDEYYYRLKWEEEK